METETLQAPPVVAVIVVHDPGDWFEETLETLADQDYPNLRFLFLVTAGDPALLAEVNALVTALLPQAFVRGLDANPGFGPAANEALRLVEGDNGFFLLCHDDIAPEPDAVRQLVEEIYRSNAGIVGPKLLDWDLPGVLQSVGLELDRFGEIDNVVEPGEIDQEQHDGVRDVFVVSSACMLVRADLMRSLGGFDPGIDFHGDDVELCWRAHHSGARVVVVPAARVRHRGRLEQRRPDLPHRRMEARHRMRAVATLTAGPRLPGRSLQLLLLTVLELVVGLFTGKFGQAWASLRALVGLVPRTPALIARRRVVAACRRVPEREVAGLQERGSARLNAFFRSRDTATYVAQGAAVRRWRPSTVTPVITWIAVVAGVLLGSRVFISTGVPDVGEFLAIPESPRLLLDSYASGWSQAGAGSTAPNPTGWALLSGLSVLTAFRTGLLGVALVIGLVLLGALGTWRLSAVFPSTRARISALLVYVASPLVSGALSLGSTTTLVAFASTPWVIHTLRRAVGIETAHPDLADDDLVDGVVALSAPERVRRLSAATVIVAVATAFAPIMLVVAGAVAVVLALGSALALAGWRTTSWFVGAGVVAVGGGALLNFPWVTAWTWDGLAGPPPIGEVHRGLWRTAIFEIGATDLAGLTAALYLPVVAALLLGRAWRLTWAVRAGVLVVVFGGLAVLGDRGSLPITPPPSGVLLAPVAVGLALAAAAAIAAFDLDVRGGRFGWRQPLGLLANLTVAVGVLPGVLATADGAWQTPGTTLPRQLDVRLPDDVAGGYNVLFLGDARLIPVPSTGYRDGVAFAVVDGDQLDLRDRWAAPSTEADAAIRRALDEIARGATLRVGPLLAPLGIRYVVIPEIDGAVSTVDDPLPVPLGLREAISQQLDVVSLRGAATLRVYENTSALPRVAMLDGATAEASATAGDAALVRADLADWTTPFPRLDHLASTSAAIDSGVVHLAIPFDVDWSLEVDGRELEPRRAFGLTTAFDVPSSGQATLRYRTDSLRSGWLALQAGLWAVVLFGAMRVSVSLAQRRAGYGLDETLIDLDEPAALASTAAWVIDPTLAIPVADDPGEWDLDLADVPVDGISVDDRSRWSDGDGDDEGRPA